MHRLFFAGGEFVTSDAIAEELMRFAVELAKRNSAYAVEVPTLDSSGRIDPVTFVLGPASQVASKPAPELDDVDMTDALHRLRDERSAETTRRDIAVYDEASHTFIDEF